MLLDAIREFFTSKPGFWLTGALLGLSIGLSQPRHAAKVEVDIATINTGDVVVDKLDSLHHGVIVTINGDGTGLVYHYREANFGKDNSMTHRVENLWLVLWKLEGK